MDLNLRKLPFALLGNYLMTVVSGCAPATYRAHPQFETLTKNIKTSGFTAPDVRIYEFTAGGVCPLDPGRGAV